MAKPLYPRTKIMTEKEIKQKLLEIRDGAISWWAAQVENRNQREILTASDTFNKACNELERLEDKKLRQATNLSGKIELVFSKPEEFEIVESEESEEQEESE
jgi:hypothetical protein